MVFRCNIMIDGKYWSKTFQINYITSSGLASVTEDILGVESCNKTFMRVSNFKK